MGLLIFRIRTSREAAADNREATKTMVEAMRQMGKMVAEHDRWLAEDGGGVSEGLLEALAAAGLDPEKSYGLLAELAAALTPKDAGDAKLSASAPSGYRPPPGGLGEGDKPRISPPTWRRYDRWRGRCRRIKTGGCWLAYLGLRVWFYRSTLPFCCG